MTKTTIREQKQLLTYFDYKSDAKIQVLKISLTAEEMLKDRMESQMYNRTVLQPYP
jgi:hypothetical protein